MEVRKTLHLGLASAKWVEMRSKIGSDNASSTMNSPFNHRRTLLLALALSAPLDPPSAMAAVLRVAADHPTIQAAVNAAASGDTIQIASGLYEEQIIIRRKNLTLEGAPGATIRMVEGGAKPILGLETTYMVGVDRCTNVVMRGLTFDGDRLGDVIWNTANPRTGFGGVLYSGSGGIFEHCIVRGFRHRERLQAMAFMGFLAQNEDAPGAPEIIVRHCRFSDNGVGIQVRGNSSAKSQDRLKFLIEDNHMEGIGPSLVGEQVGIWVSYGATGSVIGNRVSNHNYLQDRPEKSFGILALDWYYWVGFSPTAESLRRIRIENNTLIGNQWSIASINSAGSVIENNFIDGASPREGIGIGLTGATNQVIGNTISRATRGIVLIGTDPEYKNALGRANNPTLTNNSFCEVATNVVIQPLVTGTKEIGSLVCPFPAPTLAIEPAVTLSFPSSERGMVIESAPAATGPWTVLDTPVNVHGNTASATVNAGAAASFFRLRKP